MQYVVVAKFGAWAGRGCIARVKVGKGRSESESEREEMDVVNAGEKLEHRSARVEAAGMAAVKRGVRSGLDGARETGF